MAKVITTELQHAGASSANITLASDGSVTLPADTVDIATLSASGTASSSTFLRGDNSWASAGVTSDSDHNTVAGTNAGNAGTWSGAIDNTCVGYDAGTAITNGDKNVAVGKEALKVADQALRNVAIGNKALVANTRGNDLVAVGFEAGKSFNTTNGDGSSIFIGNYAGDGVTTATESVFIGHSAASAALTHGWCTIVGSGAGNSLTSGQDSTFIGNNAGSTTTTSTCQTIVGSGGSRASAATSTNYETVIGCGAVGKGASTAYISPGSGAYQGNNSSSWSTTSDQRIKKDIVDNNVGLSVIDQVKVRNFKYKEFDIGPLVKYQKGDTLPSGKRVGQIKSLPTYTPKTSADAIDWSEFGGGNIDYGAIVIEKSGTQIGAIAQELEAVCPGCVTTQTTGVKTVDTDELFWHLVNAVKELSTKVKALEAG